MAKQIYILAHFGDFRIKPADGGQTSARRFLDTLRELGYKLDVTNRKSKNSGGAFLARLYALYWGVVAFIKFLFKLLLGNRKEGVSLSICYCGSMMPFDALTALTARALGYRHIMYIKGGRTKPQYVNGSTFYKKLFRSAIKKSSLILVEGEENLVLCNSICNTEVLYFPNYTEYGFAPEILPNKPSGVWNFVYFGRICPEKNTLFVIEIFNEISKYVPRTHLYIIGKGGAEYLGLVNNAIVDSEYKDRIELLPVMKHDELKECLRTQHFFIFPSEEPNEGHSNSLNEAMAWGVVPIVSNNNFLPSIVGNNSFVVIKKDVKDYCYAINSIINSGNYGSYSEFVFSRVKTRFTQTIIEEKLRQALELL